MLTKEEKQEIIDKWFYYSALAIAEAKKLESSDQKPKRTRKLESSINNALEKRRVQRYKKS